VHRYQHLYAWGLYSLAWAGELKSQLTYLRTGVVTGSETPGTAARVGSFALEKGLWLLVLAAYVREIGLLRLAVLLLVAETLASLLAAVTTVVGHVNVGLEPEPGLPGAKWAAHIVRTTASFNTRSVLVRFWTGGLTHHLAHHLRPVALRSELPRLHATTVQDVVASTGVPQSEYPTLTAAVAAHYRRLRELGRPTATQPAA
jgi:linoleoyl-CoA desaturase